MSAEVSVELNQDGTARVATATQDIGTGTYTILAQLVAEATGIELEKIKVAIGDSRLPPGPLSGGSQVTASLVPAVAQAAHAAIQQMLTTATRVDGSPFVKHRPDSLAFGDGMVYRRGPPPGTGVPFARILQAAQISNVSGKGRSGPSQSDPDASRISIHSYCAHFVEVTWQPETARLRVSQVLSVIDGGKIINTRTGRNQIEGAIAMGVGMALFEETDYDPVSGAALNSSLADYMMTTNADLPRIDVTLLNYPDIALNSIGARGIGEIGLVSAAPAIANAVFHATGVRVRDLPIRIEDLLLSEVVA
ncbi:xanthine dehydrogenase family protein molybdopterin-binding subunit [Paraburkholderia sediminicola]|uniref:xanthine dehydrogenase family protein molybdopterin-binding subunit n=1 Tax=Paraburkholderia sediminicola TaxID=458836 RepID=UPI0038BCA09A